MGVQFRQPPVVADAHFFPAIAGNLREKRAEFFAQLEVGRKFLELLGRNRGHIDGVRGNAQQQVVADLLGDADADDFLRLFGGAGDVGSGDDVWVGDQTRVLGRLGLEDVEPGARHLARFEPGQKRRLVHQFSARAIDDAQPGLRERERPRV